MRDDYQIASPYLRLMLLADPKMQRKIEKHSDLDLQSLLNADYIEGSTINTIFEVLQQGGLQSWVTEYAEQLGVGNHGPLGFAALSAPNLKTAIDVMANFSSIRSSGTQIVLRQNKQRLEYVLVDLTHNPLVGQWLIESSFLVIQRVIETIIAHPLGPYAELHFNYPKPKHYRALDKIFNTQCRYNAQENYLSIPLSWIEIRSPLSDPGTYRSNLAKCRVLKLALDSSHKDIKHQVHTRLLNHFDRRLAKQKHQQKIPNLDILAEELFMSPRSLIRKLTAQNTSYREILDGVRQEFAEQLLSETFLTSAEISEVLAYQEPANFTRAFKRWTNFTPSQWRRKP